MRAAALETSDVVMILDVGSVVEVYDPRIDVGAGPGAFPAGRVRIAQPAEGWVAAWGGAGGEFLLEEVVMGDLAGS